MTYNITNNGATITEVRSIVQRGRRISNPSDARVLAAGLGYLYTSVSAPEYNAETQNLAHVYELVDGVIVDVWTIADKPVEVVSDGE
jgi:hypothetical protein